MFLYFSDYGWRPEGNVQFGELVEPPVSLPPVALTAEVGDLTPRLRGKWSLVYLGPGSCNPACMDSLIKMRQVRLALGNKMTRVQRVFLLTEGAPDAGLMETEHPGLVLAPAEVSRELVRLVGPVSEGDLFLVDPQGNLIMRYPAELGMAEVHADIKHLLLLSRIG